MAGANSTGQPPTTLRSSTLAAVLALGVSCTITQLALMREMLGVFAGNELVLGIILGNWLLLMGVGSTIARWAPRRQFTPGVLVGLLLFTAFMPPALVLIVRALRSFAFPRGEAIGLSATVVTSFLALLPFCLAAGYALPFACRLWSQDERATGAGKVYLMDSIGSVAGGVLFTFVLVRLLDHVAALTAPAVLNALAAAWLAWRESSVRRQRVMLTLSCLAAASSVSVWVWLANPDYSSTARQFPAQRLLFRANSPYGRVIVTASGGQTNFIESGLVLASTPDLEQAEESVHLTLAQRPDARDVLLIGGLLSGAAREVLRYRLTRLDCVELDPLITALARQFLPNDLSDRRLRLHATDARQFVRHTAATYDVVVVALPDPSTALLNRFFTADFFAEVRRVLRPGGVLSFGVGQYANYASPELASVLSCARTTAVHTFRNVLLLPAGRVYCLASDGPLTTDIASGLTRAGVTTLWVNRSYLAATLTPDRIQDLARAATHPAPVNRDFAPALYFLHTRHWASQFGAASRSLIVVLVALIVACTLRFPATAGALLVSGFAGSALEVVLLLAMQTLAGAVYQQVAWVVALFMAGLAAGSWASTRWLASRGLAEALVPQARRTLAWTALGIGVLSLVLPGLVVMLAHELSLRGGGNVIQAVLLVFTFVVAVFVGTQFPLANQSLARDPTLPAARLYTADFLGASLGAFLASAWLLPLAGISGVCWTSAGLNLGAAVILVLQRNSS